MSADKQISRLGLLSDAAACAKKLRSLSIRTADGHQVSILNDDQCASARSVSSTISSASTIGPIRSMSSASSFSMSELEEERYEDNGSSIKDIRRQRSVPEMTLESSPFVGNHTQYQPSQP
ncbi:hypothetical protein LPJ56_005475, partial [Coemansia sp. RSA 2599]